MINKTEAANVFATSLHV